MERNRSQLIVAVVFGVLLILLAFALPQTSSDAERPPEAGVDLAIAGDGAGIPDARSGVVEPQPRDEFEPKRLAPGEEPPQFVVLSIDGGCATRSGAIRNLLGLGQEISGRFTFFISGLCIIPAEEKMAYRPPGHEPGQSDIGFGDL